MLVPVRHFPAQFHLSISITGLFQLYDIDKDGTITYKEMVSIVKANHKVTSSVQNSRENEPTPEEVRLFFGAQTCVDVAG